MRAWHRSRLIDANIRSARCSIRRFSAFPAASKEISIAELLQPSHDGPVPSSDIEINGYVQSIRKQKKVAFAAIRDGSSLQPLQAVLNPTQAHNLSNGAAVRLKGSWVQCPPGKQQSHELQVESATLLGENDPANDPVQNKYQSSRFLRTIPHLRPRLPANALLLRLRSKVIASLTNHFADEGFTQTHTPTITSSDCEGAGEVFTISSNASQESDQGPKPGSKPVVEHFFRDPKYLTVSAQLHLETLSQSVGKVWTLSPTFRAEKSNTPRHLSEFYMLEAEIGFVEDLNKVMDVVEQMLRYVAEDISQSKISEELLQAARERALVWDEESSVVSDDVLAQRWRGMLSSNWPRITYADAIQALEEAVNLKSVTFEHTPSYQDGLQGEHERFLASVFGNGRPVFVTHYPRDQKPFYMAPSMTGGQKTSACFDLLVPDVCELVGGSMREHRSKELLESMQRHGLVPKTSNDPSDIGNLQWYMDLRRYGSVPHGGFGLGFDRLLSYLSGVPNIRDVVAFPRWYGRCDA